MPVWRDSRWQSLDALLVLRKLIGSGGAGGQIGCGCRMGGKLTPHEGSHQSHAAGCSKTELVLGLADRKSVLWRVVGMGRVRGYGCSGLLFGRAGDSGRGGNSVEEASQPSRIQSGHKSGRS